MRQFVHPYTEEDRGKEKVTPRLLTYDKAAGNGNVSARRISRFVSNSHNRLLNSNPSCYSTFMNNSDLDPNREPTPQQPTEQLPPSPDNAVPSPVVTEKKANKGLFVTLISLVVLLLALGAVYLFWYLPNKTEDAPATTTTHETHRMTAKEVITETNTYITTDLQMPTDVEPGLSPTYKPAGANVSVASRVDQVISVSPEEPDTTADRAIYTALYEKVVTHLEKTHMLTRADISEGENLATLTSDAVTCSVDFRFDSLIATCEDIATLMKVADELKPFTGIDPSSKSAATIYNLEHHPSKTDGYQLATVSVSYDGPGATALFYKKGTADWTYFTSAQAALPCAEYTTDDLKNAYHGETCGDSDGNEMTVQAAKVE